LGNQAKGEQEAEGDPEDDDEPNSPQKKRKLDIKDKKQEPKADQNEQQAERIVNMEDAKDMEAGFSGMQ
jgi:hypothetical protein